ncbi:MAG TPA: tetratricopeptide repeat protein [Kofleriaceae bacterium]|nr:tetratricopeptide repeat protein [Kofleriaceae bacterium]
MKPGRPLYAMGWVAASIGAVGAVLAVSLARGPVARGQPIPRPAPVPTTPPAPPTAPPAPPTAPPAQLAPAPRPAGSSAIESPDVPAWTPSPARFAVTPFENRSNVRAFDWLVAGAPFEISEKTEAVLGLDPTGGPLHVGGAAVLAEPGSIAAFAAAREARFVITGWVDRPSWQLRIDLSLWKVTGGSAVVAAEAQRTGDVKAYHQLLGEALGEVWSKGGGVTVDAARTQRLSRPLASDLYAVTLMGRGLGHLTGALASQAASHGGAGSAAAGSANGPGAATLDPRTGTAGGDLKAAEHDLERAVFIDPRCFEAQRLLGELYLMTASGDPKLTARAAGKFNYANDLAPDDIAALRGAAGGAAQAGKHELALGLFRKLVTQRPWDLDARYELGAALWRTGDPVAAEKQLEQVTAHRPDHLAARRVLVLIHASRSDTLKLAGELEAIATRAPNDLEIKADLASAYGALAQWDKAIAALEAIVAARPTDVALHVRIGDAHRKQHDLDGALAWYARAGRLVPESSWPGYAAAQALFDAGKLVEANRAYTSLQRYRDDLPAAEQALGVIALVQNRPDDAAWYLRRAALEAPRTLLTWRALVAAELLRKDAATAIKDAGTALPTWPHDAALHYLAGVAYARQGEATLARQELTAAASADPALAAPRAALSTLDAGGNVAVSFTPELVRPWGDADALTLALDRFAVIAQAMARARAAYQYQLLGLLGVLHRGPNAPVKSEPVRSCPVARLATSWAAAQRELGQAERLGVDLEATWRFIARHDEVGATASLLPNARTQVATSRKAWKLALADIAELRAEWGRVLGPELSAVGCTERLLAAAVADPTRYYLGEEDPPEPIPAPQPPRPRARATFYVDNTRCNDLVEVWIDGTQLGQVAPGRRSALVADGGERTLCLLVPGAAQCGDRGTVRQVYLHDGWSVTMHCAN